MSDFFTRLAERTLGFAPILQPIIAPLFAQEVQQMGEESLEATLEAATSPMMGQQNLTAVQNVQPFLSSNQERMEGSAKGPLSSETPFAAAEPIYHNVISTIAEHGTETASLSVSTDSTPAHISTEVRVEPFSVHPIEMGSQVSTASQSSRPLLQAQAHGETQSTSTRAKFVAPDPTTPNAIIADFVAANERESPLAAIQTQREAVAQFPRQAISSSQMDDIPAGNSREVQHFKETRLVVPATTIAPVIPVPSTLSSVPPLPTIQVTIGRIEVRATPSVATAPPAHHQRNEPLVKSLDDYLRQRAKGGR